MSDSGADVTGNTSDSTLTNTSDGISVVEPNLDSILSSSTHPHHHTQLQQPQQQHHHESINLYGSYIPDSYVGDFSGEVDPEMAENADLQQDNNSWQEENKGLDGEIEFSFDSFGPESILFPRSSEMINDDDSTGKQLGNLTKDNDFIPNVMPRKISRASNSSIDSKLRKSRRKITANRDLLNSDDIIHDDPPRVKGVTFSNTVEENSIPELTVREELDDTRNWRKSCPIGDNGDVKKIDLKVIEPYKKVLSHGGYYHHYNSALSNKNNTEAAPGPAIIIFSACYLPDRSRKDYDYVMNNLFMYVLTTLHELVADDYILIYFHNAGGPGVSSNNMPTLSWFKRCYTMIDRRLRKNLKNLFLVHPTFWLKTFVIMTKPFISTKFARKLKFVSTLAELNEMVPIESTIIPPPVKQYDKEVASIELDTK